MKNVLIFDYDGVLVDSFDTFMQHFISACKEENLDKIANKEDFLDLFENNMYESMFDLGLTKDKIIKIVYKLKDGLLKDQDKIDLFPGIKKVVRELSKSKKNKLIIVTSSETNVVKKFLKMHNIDSFEAVIGSDKEASKVKKIEKIKSEFNNGSKFYYIGDTKGDIIEGKNAGVKTVGVTWGWHGKNRLKEEAPEYLVNKPRQLTKLFLQ